MDWLSGFFRDAFEAILNGNVSFEILKKYDVNSMSSEVISIC